MLTLPVKSTSLTFHVASESILYTVTVNYTENIVTIVNNTITEVFEDLYEQVSHVNCSKSLPTTSTSFTPTKSNSPKDQSSDSSASSLLLPLLGTLGTLMVIITVSVCVVAALIIVRHKRRKEGPHNLRYVMCRLTVYNNKHRCVKCG